MNFFCLLNILIELSVSREIYFLFIHIYLVCIFALIFLKKIDKTSRIEFLSILNITNNTNMLI